MKILFSYLKTLNREYLKIRHLMRIWLAHSIIFNVWIFDHNQEPEGSLLCEKKYLPTSLQESTIFPKQIVINVPGPVSTNPVFPGIAVSTTKTANLVMFANFWPSMEIYDSPIEQDFLGYSIDLIDIFRWLVSSAFFVK